MIALVSIAYRVQEADPQPIDLWPRVRRWRCLWQSMMIWLFEPIPFPGQWPISNGQAQRYNKKEEKLIPSALDDLDIDER